MTTNRTIDGVLVSRELLESFAAYVSDSPNAIMRARAKELRALLDAAAVASDGVNWKAVANEQMGIIQALKAAQPQGEPVAWMDPRSPEMHASISNEVKQHNLKFGGAPAAAVNGYSIPLYAEQPAPVAVVRPERREPKHYWPRFGKLTGTARVAAEEWNSCLDELKRLNTN